MMGVVEGGWGFVVAAYTVTAFVLGAYVTSVFLRYAEAGREKKA